MVGHIYIIKNCINDKVYIGQTVQSVQDRFQQHKYMAKRDVVTSKLYKAMQELGIDKFYCKELQSIDTSEESLTELEKSYIVKYNSIYAGYNSTLPCVEATYHNLFEYYGDNILDDYLGGSSYNEIAYKYKISRNSVAKILACISRLNQYNKARYRSEPYKVVMYNTDFVPLGTFSSIKEAIKWIKLNTHFNPDLRNGYNYIHSAILKGNIAYGHRWQLYDELLYDGKRFRTKFDVENYKAGNELIPKDGYYICGDISSLIRVGGYRQIKHPCILGAGDGNKTVKNTYEHTTGLT